MTAPQQASLLLPRHVFFVFQNDFDAVLYGYIYILLHRALQRCYKFGEIRRKKSRIRIFFCASLNFFCDLPSDTGFGRGSIGHVSVGEPCGFLHFGIEIRLHSAHDVGMLLSPLRTNPSFKSCGITYPDIPHEVFQSGRGPGR